MKRTLFMTALLTGALFLAACAPMPAAPAGAPAAVAEPASAAMTETVAMTDTAAATDTVDRTGWPEKFLVGFFGGDDAEKTLQDNEPFRLYMEERLGMPVELFTGTSYTAVIEAMRAKRVDAMLVGPFSYVLAVQEAQAEALAINVGLESDTPVYDPTVPTHYYSVIFTKKGSGIATLADLTGKDFAFVDPASTSGHLAPKTLLIQNGIDPDSEMNTVFAGSHATSVLSVWEDKAPAGATYESNLYTLLEEGQVEFCGFADGKLNASRTAEEIQAVYDACPEGSLVIIAYSDEIPSTPFAARSDLPESFKATIKQALLDIKDNPELISQIAQWYVDPTAELGLEALDQYYNSLRDIAQLLNLDLKELAR
jgi:phosphonate transport system substrate-binding protein